MRMYVCGWQVEEEYTHREHMKRVQNQMDIVAQIRQKENVRSKEKLEKVRASLRESGGWSSVGAHSGFGPRRLRSLSHTRLAAPLYRLCSLCRRLPVPSVCVCVLVLRCAFVWTRRLESTEPMLISRRRHECWTTGARHRGSQGGGERLHEHGERASAGARALVRPPRRAVVRLSRKPSQRPSHNPKGTVQREHTPVRDVRRRAGCRVVHPVLLLPPMATPGGPIDTHSPPHHSRGLRM